MKQSKIFKVRIKNLKLFKLYFRFIRARDFLHKIGIKFRYFFIPAALSLATAFFDSLSTVLLIPLLKGVIDRDFGFVREMPVLKNIIMMLPQAVGRDSTSLFIFLIVLIFTVAIMRHIFGYCAIITLAYQTNRFSNGLRKRLFDRHVKFGKLFFDRTSYGHINNVIMRYSIVVANQIEIFQNALTIMFTLIFYLVCMFVISWKLTFIVISVFPILHYVLKKIIRKVKEISEGSAIYVDRLAKKAVNVFSSIALVKVYANEEEEKKDFAGLSDIETGLDFRNIRVRRLVEPIQQLFTLFTLLALIAIVAFIFVKQKSGEMSAFLVYFYILKRNIGSMGVFNNLRASLAGVQGPIKRILYVLNDENKYFVVGGKKEFSGLKRDIQINRLNFSYTKEVPVLKNVSLSFSKGKMTALVGPTGSGKTTLISLILRFYDCPSSTIFIDGEDIRGFSIKSLMRHMALVSQETFLLNDTLKANITYGLDNISKEKLIEAVKRAQLYGLVMKLPKGLDTLIGDRGVQLSGGEKQRVSVARALLKGAEILILDEATSALDTHTERLIQEAIEEAVKGRTTMVIAHRLSTIKNADKIVVIEEGRFAEEGTLEGLLKKQGKFYHYWEAQKFY